MIELMSDSTFLSVMLHTTLKGSMLIVVVGLIQWLGRDRIPPMWRYAMWLLVVLRLLLPAGPESRFSLFNLVQPSVAITRHAPVAAAVLPTIDRTPLSPATARQETLPMRNISPLGLTLVGLWGFGALFLLASASASTRAFSRRLDNDGFRTAARAETLAAARLLLERSRQRMNIRKRVELVETSTVDSPALHGFIRPRILLPVGLLETFDGDELEYIFLHELAHQRRHDVLLNLLASFVQAVHWFNPLVWLAFSRMREERELACDEMALEVLRQEERPRYGRTILKLLESFHTSSTVPALVGITNHKEQMRRRITMIATFQKHSRKSILFAALLITIGAVSLTEAQQNAPKVRMIRSHAPEAAPTIERLEAKISLNLAEATIEDVFNAISNQTGVRISVAPELAPSIGTLDRLSIKAENIPSHMALVHAASAVGLAVDFDADGAIVSKSEDSHPRVMVFHKQGDSHGEVSEELTKIMVSPDADGQVATFDDGTGPKKVIVHKMRKPAEGADAEAPIAHEEIEKIIQMHAPEANGVKHRVQMIAPGTDGALGKTLIEVRTKDAEGAEVKGSLDIQVHSNQEAM